MQEMDPDYDLKTWDISLKKMALFKVIKDIVEVSRLNPTKISIDSQINYHISGEKLIIESRAIERAKNLQIPKTLITDIIHMIQPIMKEMLAWYKVNGNSVCPILTPQGTVDVQKSAKAMFEFSGLRVMTLFKVACRYFMEGEIFDYGKRLTQDEKKCIADTRYRLEVFWLVEVYQQEFNKKKTLEGLTARQCFNGFELAWGENMFFSLERFLATSLKKAHNYMTAERIYTDVYNHKMSPVLLWKLQKINRFGRFGRRFPFKLLKSLLNWPYQHLFAKAAKTLVTSLNEEEFTSLLSHIIRMGRTGYKDHDYGGLFKCFWKMGKQHLQSKRVDLCEIRIHWYLWGKVGIGGKDIAFMVFDYMFQTCKDWILSEFNEMCTCFIVWKEYEVLRVLWDMGATRDTRVHLKFKNFYESQRDRRSHFIKLLSGWFLDSEVNSMLDAFQRVLSEWETS